MVKEKVNNGKDVIDLLSVLIDEVRLLRECVNGPKSLYTNKEMKEVLKIDDKTLRKYRNDGLIGYSQIRDKFYYTHKDLSEFLSNNHMSAYYYN